MGIGISLVLIAVGAVLRFAVTADAEGINLQTVGLILMIVGGIGIILSLIFWSSWGGVSGGNRRVIVDDASPASPEEVR